MATRKKLITGKCSRCYGAGYILYPGNRCPTCKGNGHVTQTIEETIPFNWYWVVVPVIAFAAYLLLR